MASAHSRLCTLSHIGCITFFVLIFMPLTSLGGSSVVGLTVLPSASTAYRIKLYANCSALWTISYSIPLLNAEDQANFESYALNVTSSRQEFLNDFAVQMSQVVGEASNVTDRDMYATGFDLSATAINTPTIQRGTITYSFLWVGFLEGTTSTLFMGDVFEGGLYLYENDSLTVIPPEGYRGDFVSPSPDAMNGVIVWHGPLNFPSGEPAIEFVSKETKLSLSFEKGEVVEGDEVAVGGLIEPPLAALVRITYTSPDGRTIDRTVETSQLGAFTSKITADAAGTWKAQASWDGNDEYDGCASQVSTLIVKSKFDAYALAPYILAFMAVFAVSLIIWQRRRKPPVVPLPPPPEDDEERVLALLRSEGGQMLQQDIGRKLGFSKSKTTGILNNLEAKNLIEKEKKGRRYLVNVARKQ